MAESSFNSDETKGAGKGFGSLLVKVVIVAVSVIGIGVGIYFYLQYDKSQKLLKNPNLSAQMEQKSLIEKVGKLIDLPVGEEPTVATVSDVSKLKGQSFFDKAQNGYKVLIYAKAKKAILYDPQKNKIVEVGPINIGSEKQNPSAGGGSPAQSDASLTAKIILYNGTKTVGLASTVEKELKTTAKGVTVVSKGNAKNNYTKTLVVDLTGKQKLAAAELAKLLNGEVGNLPSGEAKPASAAADLLVILGK